MMDTSWAFAAAAAGGVASAYLAYTLYSAGLFSAVTVVEETLGPYLALYVEHTVSACCNMPLYQHHHPSTQHPSLFQYGM